MIVTVDLANSGAAISLTEWCRLFFTIHWASCSSVKNNERLDLALRVHPKVGLALVQPLLLTII